MIKSIYRQLMDSIKRKILSGELAVGDKLESERDMSKKYNISRMTVRKALKFLENEGVLESIRGSGTYVKSLPKNNDAIFLGDQNDILSLTMQIRQKGMRSSRVVLSMQRVKPKDEVKIAFQNENSVYEIIRMALINDTPYAMQKHYLPCSLFNDAECFDFQKGSLYAYMQDRGYRPQTMTSYLRIAPLPDEYMEIMKVPKGKKFLLFNYYGYSDQQKLVEYTISFHHPQYTKFKFVTNIYLGE